MSTSSSAISVLLLHGLKLVQLAARVQPEPGAQHGAAQNHHRTGLGEVGPIADVAEFQALQQLSDVGQIQLHEGAPSAAGLPVSVTCMMSSTKRLRRCPPLSTASITFSLGLLIQADASMLRMKAETRAFDCAMPSTVIEVPFCLTLVR